MTKTPTLTIRFKTKRQLELMRRAARLADVSLNKWTIKALEKQATQDIGPIPMRAPAEETEQQTEQQSA